MKIWPSFTVMPVVPPSTGGTFATARGYVSLSGARGPLDFNLFGQQLNTDGQGVNDAYSNSSQGANVGLRLSQHAAFRLHVRHSNERSGVPELVIVTILQSDRSVAVK